MICGALSSAASAGFILAQAPRRRAAQLAALLPLAAAWWASCEAAWNAAPDAAAARSWFEISSLGWVWIGGLVPHLILRYVDLAQLLDDAAAIARPQIGPDVRVERRYDDAPDVVCAPEELRQVFLNLIVNAAQAVDGVGTIRLVSCADGDAVVARVGDDGPGMPSEIVERIFDPFFTTKKVGEGTGLGLGIAHQIVANHGGEIEVESSPGQGAVFSVRLPV